MGTTDKKQAKKTKRARLGRGLSSLVDSPPLKVEAQESLQSPNSKPVRSVDEHLRDRLRVLELPIGSIQPNAHQPRRVFDKEALSALAESLKTQA